MLWSEFRVLLEGLFATESRLYRVTQPEQDSNVMPDMSGQQ